MKSGSKRVNNVNVNSFQELKNVNVNDDRFMRVIRDAIRLGEKFGDGEKSWKYYLKVAWRLTPAEIWGNAEEAFRGEIRKSPAQKFAFLNKLTGKMA